MEIMVILLGMVIVLGLGGFYIVRLLESALSRSRMETHQALQGVSTGVQNQMESLKSVTEERFKILKDEVDKKLSETVTKNFESFGAVSKRLEELQAATGQVVSLSQGVRDLSKILESPKLRGAMGEFQLGEMLRQVLPEEVFEEQYAIEAKSKESVDAAIKFQEGLLCIDSKFPLVNARKLLEDGLTPEERVATSKAFEKDVKVMVDSIASKYIIPDKTLDFAFMFIPAESIYYELMKDSKLHQFCLNKHVIPVSPNSFYAYLQAVAVGFRGLKIQGEAKKIAASLGKLKKDFGRFNMDFAKVGKHLKDAQTQYGNVENRIEKMGGVIDKLGLETNSEEEKSLPAPSPNPELTQ